MSNLKFTDTNETELTGLLAPHGGPFNGRDIAGEFFSAKTDFVLDLIAGERPLLYHHGLDAKADLCVIGRIKSLSRDDLGLWMQAQLDTANEYYSAIKQLIKQGKLGLSSGSMRHLTITDGKSGEILRWPLIEGSLTPTPCNPLAEVDFASAEKHYELAGIKANLKVLQEGSDAGAGYLAPEQTGRRLTSKQPTVSTSTSKAELSSEARDNLDDSDFAYVDSDGGRHLPIHDAAHVRNALARFEQTEFDSDAAKEKARKKVEAAARKFDIETDTGKKSVALKALEGSYEDLIEDLNNLVNPYSPFISDCYSYVLATYPDHCIVRRCERGECTYWRVEYTVGPDGEPTLGKATEVEETFVPVRSAEAETESLITQAQKAAQLAALVTERAEALRDRRIKSGREVSSANHGHVQALHARMSAAHAEMGQHLADMAGFLDRTDPNKRAQAEAEAKATQQRLDVELESLRLFVAAMPRTP